MTKDAAQRSPSALLRAVSMSNGSWTFYETIIVEFTRLTLGDEYHSLVGRFNRFARELTARKGGYDARTFI